MPRLLFLFVGILHFNFLFAQTGPGGVEDYTSASNLKLWVSADSLTGLSDNDEVSAWPDISAEMNDGSQGTSSLRPLYDLTNTANGRPTLSFDGGDFIDFPSPGIGATSSFDYFIVLRANSFATGGVAAGGGDYILDRTSGSTPLVSLKASTGGFFGFQKRADNSTGLGGPVSTTGISTTDFQLVSFGRNAGTEFTIHVDGTEEDNAADGSNLTPPVPRLGRHATNANDGLIGNIAEFIIFDKYLNSAERILINNYLGAKYGVTVSNDLFSFEGTHGNQVAGIGQASDGSNQTSANSSLAFQISGATDLQNGEFALIGHDAGDMTAWSTIEIPAGTGSIERLAREWVIDKNAGDLGDITFQVDANELASATYTNYVLLVDADGDFTSGSTIYQLTDQGGGLHSFAFSNALIPDGSYITIGNINPTIQWATDSTGGFETDTNPSFSIALNYTPTTNVTVTYTTADGTATTAGSDYTGISTTATINSGTNSTSVNITVNDDGSTENTEDFTITLTAPSDGSTIGIPTIEYSILDNDNTRKASMVASSGSGGEAAAPNVFVSVQISSVNFSNDTDISYQVTGGTAIENTDYTIAGGGVVTIPSGATQNFFTISITDDAFEESDETIEITLFDVSPEASLSEGGDITFTYTINNDDNVPTAQFSTTSTTESEATTAGVVQVDLNAPSLADVTLNYTVGGLALGGSVDHNLADGSLVISAGNVSGNFIFSVEDDDVPENTEDLIITLTGATGAALGANTVFTYNITDNDPFGSTGPGGVGSSTVNRAWLRVEDGASNLNTTVGGSTSPTTGNTFQEWEDLSGNGNHAFINGTSPDYVNTANQPTYTENDINGKGTVTFTGNQWIDAPDLMISNSTSGYSYFMVTEVNTGAASGGMSDGAGDFLLDRTTATQNLVSLKVTNTDKYGFQKRTDAGNALGGPVSTSSINFDNYEIISLSRLRIDENNADYFLHVDGTLEDSETGNPNEGETTPPNPRIGRHATNENNGLQGEIAEFIVFSSYLNDTRRIIVENYLGARYNLPIATDRYAYEASYGEDVSGFGQNGTDSDDFHLEGQSAGIMTASNASSLDDGDWLLFGHDGGDATAWATAGRPDGSFQRIARTWRFDETTAGDGVGTVSLSFETMALPTLPSGFSTYYLLRDTDGDFTSGSEQFELSLNGSVASIDNFSIADGDYITVAVRNDILITFVSPTVTVSESTSPLTISVTLSQAAGTNVDVDYEVTGGDATGTGTDYTLANGTLNFLTGDTPPNDTLQTFDITITTADTNVELDETIEVTLRNAVFGAVGADSVLTVTIQDDDNDGFSGPGGVGDDTNNALWIQASKFALSDGATVTVDWEDQSGNDRDLVANGDPTFRSGGINGQPSVDLDGVGDFFLDADGNYMNGSAGFNIFTVVQSDDASTDRGLINTETPDGGDDRLGLRYDAGGASGGGTNVLKIAVDATGGSTQSETANNTQTTDPQLISFSWSGATISTRFDGSDDTPTSAGGNATGTVENSNLVYVGAGPKDDPPSTEGWDGDIGEVIFYDQLLNSTQINIVENYLGAKFQILTLGNDLYAHQLSNGQGLAGIGRVSSSDFHTKAMSDSLMVVSNASDLEDGEYFLFAHNDGDASSWGTSEVPGTNFSRLAREWRVDETGGDGDVGSLLVGLLSTNLAANPAGQDQFAMLTDADGDFSTGATVTPLQLNGSTYETTSNFNIADDNYVTFGVFESFTGYSDTTALVSETVGAINLPVELNYPVVSDVTINYQIDLANTTATAVDDYDLVNGSIVIPAGSSSGNITFNVVDDMVSEVTDTLVVQLTSVDLGSLTTDDNYWLIINDDDNVVDIDFTIASSSGLESVSPANIFIRLNQTSGTNTDVVYTVSGGTASDPEDFSLASGTATITAGDLTTNLAIPIQDDVLAEIDETIEITLTSPTNGNLGANIMHTYTIQDDDDDLTVEFSNTEVGAAESAGTANVEVVLSSVAGSTLTVNYQINAGTATGGGVDYTLSNGSIDFTAGEDREVIVVTLDDDVLVEGAESFDIELTTVSSGLVLGTNTTTTFTIVDNDNDGFVGPGGVGNSTNNLLWIRADQYSLSDGATVTTDWIDQSGNNFDLAVVGDPTYRSAGINSQPSIDFDGAGDHFLDADGNYLNGSSAYTMITVVQSNNASTDRGFFDTTTPNDGDDVLAFRYDAGGADGGGTSVTKSGIDATGGSTRIESSNNSQSTSPQLILSTWSGTTISNRFNGADDTPTSAGGNASGTIENSDMIYVGAGPKDNTLASEGWDGDIGEFILYNSSLNSTQINIVENYVANKFGITIPNDYFAFQSSFGSDLAGFGQESSSDLHTGAQSAGILTISNGSSINDGDYAFFGHDNTTIASWSATDAPSNMQRLTRRWRIDYDQTGDGDIGVVAVEVLDTSLPSTPAGFDDFFLLVDADGNFATAATAYPLTDNGDNTHSATGVTIADDDFIAIAVGAQLVQFTLANSSVGEENGAAIIELSSTFNASDSIKVNYSVNLGTSTATGSGTDYTLADGQLVITPGNNTVNLTVPVVNDSDSESEETVIIELGVVENATLGTNDTHTLAISDDDNLRTISFSAIATSLDESEDSTAFIVQNNFVDNSNPTTVDYTLSGTATNGNIDYLITPAAGTLTIPATQTTDTLFIFINEDILDEEDETIIVTLSNSANASLGTNSIATHTIQDNDNAPTAQFSNATTASSEAINPGSIEVSLSSFSGNDVTVTFTVAAGTATSGIDYVLANGSLIIPAGSLTGEILPAILQDSDIEGTENFTVTLTGATNATLGTTTMNTFTIVDDDNEGFTGPGGVGNSSNNVLWLRTDTGVLNGSSMDASEGENVVVWEDQSGNGNDFTITSGDNPVYRAAGINSISSIEFDGANDFMEDADGESYINGSGSITFFTIIQSDFDDGTDGGWFLTRAPVTAGDDVLGIRYDNGGASGGQDNVLKATISATPGNQSIETSANSQTTNPQLVTYSWTSGNDIDIYLDGTQETLSFAGTTRSGSANDATTVVVGKGPLDDQATEGWDGDVGELILFNQTINETQRIVVENYLSSKYALTTANDFYSYDASSTYGNDVAGIGQFGASDSHTKAQSSGVLSASNGTDIQTGEYLFFGHDNADTTAWVSTEAPSGGSNVRRLAREWRVDETGDVGTITLGITTTNIPDVPVGFDQFYLMVDTDGDFSSGATLYPTVLVGTEYEASAVDIAAGNYVGIAAVRNDIQFTLASSSEFEPDGPASIEISAAANVGQNVVVDYIVTDGTATVVEDHNLVDGSVTITTGNTTTSIPIPLVNDSDLEANETLTITITAVTAGFQVGSTNPHTFTINDDDSPRKIYFENDFSPNPADSTGGAESILSLPDGTDDIVVALTPAFVDVTNTTTADLQVKPGGTATEGVDFTLDVTTATIAAGQPNVDLSNIITIIDDDVFEGNETFTIELVNPMNGSLSNPADNPIEFKYTIEDNDTEPTIQFTNATASTVENAGSFSTEISLSGTSTSDASVTVSVTGGTATSPTDFTLTTTAVTILAGNQTANATINIVDDSDIEGLETITLTLSGPVNTSIVGNTSITISVNDNDNNGITGPGGVGNSSNNALWLRASDFSLADATTITTDWVDQSGNNHDAAVNGNPVFRTGGINSAASVDFDGAGDHFLDADGTYMNGSGGFAMFAVVQSDDATTDKGFFDTQTPSDGDDVLSFRYDVDGGGGDINLMKMALDTDAGTRAQESSSGTQTTSPQQISLSWSGSTLDLRLDGSLDTPSEPAAAVGGSIENGTSIYVGAGPKDNVLATEGWDGDIGEFILYNQSINSAEIQIVENYLAAKFGLTIAGDVYAETQTSDTYEFEVAGIGQLSGQSHNAAQSGGLITVMNPSSLEDTDFLLFGHDGEDTTSWVTTQSPTSTRRLARQWYFDETGDVGTISISIADTTGLPTVPAGFNNIILLADASEDLSSATIVTLTDIGGNEFQALNFDPSGQWIAIAVLENVTNGSGGGDWSMTSTWSAGVVPGSGESADISAGDDVHLTQNVSIGSVTINAGATLDLNGFTLTVDDGSITLNGGTLTAGTGTIEYTSSGSQTIASAITYNNLTIGGSGSKVLDGALDVNGDLTITNSLDVTGSNHAINLAGDYDNQGTFVPQEGTFTFDGSADQTLSGTLNFYSVTINNSGGNILLNDEISIDGDLRLTSGDLVLGSRNLTLSATTEINGGSASSYIQADGTGNINLNIGTIPFTDHFPFPVGDVSGDFSPFYFRLNAATTGANPSVAVNLDDFRNTNLRTDAPHLTRFWTIEPTDLSGSIDYDVAFRYVAADVEMSEADLVPIKFNADLDTAGYTQGVDYALNAGIDSVFWNGLTTFSEITAGVDEDNAVVLPIELLYVRGTVVEDDVLIEWATASETNNDYFSVEKSQDFESFETVAFIDGAGNSSETRFYEMIDPSPYPGISYYRIRQTDFDGTSTVSEAVIIEFDFNAESETSYDVYPVPFRLGEGVNIAVNNLTPGTMMTVNVYSLEGRNVLNTAYFAGSNGRIENRLFLPSAVSRGEYILSMSYSGAVRNVRIVVQ